MWVIYFNQDHFDGSGVYTHTAITPVFTCENKPMCMLYFNLLQWKNCYSKGQYYSCGEE